MKEPSRETRKRVPEEASPLDRTEPTLPRHQSQVYLCPPLEKGPLPEEGSAINENSMEDPAILSYGRPGYTYHGRPGRSYRRN